MSEFLRNVLRPDSANVDQVLPDKIAKKIAPDLLRQTERRSTLEEVAGRVYSQPTGRQLVFDAQLDHTSTDSIISRFYKAAVVTELTPDLQKSQD